ncbi:autotransporter outer membrane beta-barrel domain-containing protein [Sporomusa carbonis]|uniref:autotransporter outer membrane beta-barrel domain-containing protein n=1 Tax=Sporomusa carbonis TaxID=3076075 RepID=UPI003C7CE533
MAFGRIGGDHTTSLGLRVRQSAVNTADGKLGLLFGKTFAAGAKQGNFYAKAVVHHGFGGSGGLSAAYGLRQEDKSEIVSSCLHPSRRA